MSFGGDASCKLASCDANVPLGADESIVLIATAHPYETVERLSREDSIPAK
jgi:hypothetical protein